MITAVCLFVYGAVVAAVAPRVLIDNRSAECVPAVGVTTWLVVMSAALVAWVGGAAGVVTHVAASHKVRHVLAECVQALCAAALGAHGTAAQWIALVGGLVAAAVVTGVVTVAVRSLVRTRARTARHAESVRLLGRPDDRLGVVVLDVPERVVYTVAGRRPAIVASRAALDALDERQRDVVLAHERAHVAGRHHLPLAAGRALAAAMPSLPLFARGATELGRLLEMCADDTALRGRDPRDLVTALVVLSRPTSAPASALGAAGSAVADRAERAAASRTPATAQRARRRLVLSGLGLVVAPALPLSAVCWLLLTLV